MARRSPRRARHFDPGSSWRLYQTFVEACANATRKLNMDALIRVANIQPTEEGLVKGEFYLVRPGQPDHWFKHAFAGNSSREQLENELVNRATDIINRDPPPALAILEEMFSKGPLKLGAAETAS